MPQIKSGFTLRSTSPDFNRDQFNSFDEMKNINPGWIDDGHISFCKQDRCHYKYDINADPNGPTGRFVKLNFYEGSDTVIESEDVIIYDTLEEMKSKVPTGTEEDMDYVHSLGQIVFCKENKTHYYWGYDKDEIEHIPDKESGYFYKLSAESINTGSGVITFDIISDLYNVSNEVANGGDSKYLYGQVVFCKENETHYYWGYDESKENTFDEKVGYFKKLLSNNEDEINSAKPIVFDKISDMLNADVTKYITGQIAFCKEDETHYYWSYDESKENISDEKTGYFKKLISVDEVTINAAKLVVFSKKSDMLNASDDISQFSTGQVVYCKEDENHYYNRYDKDLNNLIKDNVTGYFAKIDKFLKFATLSEMARLNPTYLELGQIAFCTETSAHYYLAYKDTNYDNTTGYFRKLKGDATSENIVGAIYQGEIAPENKELIWLDTTEHLPAEEAATIQSLQEAVRVLTEEVSLIKLLRTNGVISGTVSDSVRVYLANSAESVKPNDDGLDEDTGETEVDYSDLEEVEPEYEDCEEPTVAHIAIKMGTWTQLKKYIKNYIPGELLWCTNKKRLYIYIDGALVMVAGGTADDDDSGSGDDNTGGDIDMDTTEIKKLIAEELQNVESIGFIPVGETEATYRVRVNEQGTLICYKKDLDEWAPSSDENYMAADSVSMSSLLINSFYLGGDGDEHSYQPCSHNYVELSNVWMKSKTAVQKDINLNGYYLLYCDGETWKSLKLWGTIKANSSFVIRGAQCSVMDANTTVIKVKNYDMEWTERTGYDDNDNPIWEPIKFNQKSAVFYLCWGDPNNPGENESEDNPGYIYSMEDSNKSISIKDLDANKNVLFTADDSGSCAKGYMDLASFNNQTICEVTTYSLPAGANAKDVLFRRWYPMDPVGQSNPDDGLAYHNNMKYLTSTYLNGSNWDDRIPIEEWTPMASWEGKSMRETRALFKEDKPNTLSITYGIQGSDNSENGGIGASRGFCWNSVGYYDEYLWIRKEGETDWEKIESYKENVLYIDSIKNPMSKTFAEKNGYKYVDCNDYSLFTWPESILSDNTGNSYAEYFTRIRWESSYGQVMTTHKVVLAGLKAGKYEYKVVRGTDESSTYQSKLREFTVRADSELKNFTYVQTTDQQGVTWEEWETWMLTARMMKKQYAKDITLPIPGRPDESPQTYQVDGRPEYLYSDTTDDMPSDRIFESKYSSDSVVYKGNTYTGYTLDESRAKTQDYNIGTIPQDYGFVINTGDICYNGSRSNEWLDYFHGQEPLDDREEMLTIGNNDLIPITMRDIGTGQESPWKINPEVIDYFYAVDFRVDNPPIFVGIADGSTTQQVSFKIPGLYSFNYGEFHFISLLSEIRTISNKITVDTDDNNNITGTTTKKLSDSTVNRIFGINDELRSKNNNKASKIYDTVEGWISRDLMIWKGKDASYIKSKYGEGMNFDWSNARFDENIVGKCTKCIFYTHEMPFNITSSNSYKNYSGASAAPRETAKAYLNRFHNFEFQRVFKLWNIPMVMGGHKHTCAMTRPVYDAPIGYNPITKKMKESYYDGTFKDADGIGIEIGYYNNNVEYDQVLHDNQMESITVDGKTHYVVNTNGEFSNAASFQPFVQCLVSETKDLKGYMELYAKEIFNNSSQTVTLELNNGTFTLAPGEYKDDLNHTAYTGYPRFRVEIVDQIEAPTYIMCQTSGFKNKSNSDLACNSEDGEIPWERFYVKGDAISEQCAPFYTVYFVKTVDEDGNPLDNPRIEVNMYRVSGMYADSGGPKGGSPEGYWSLANIYRHGNTLEENRDYFTGVGDKEGALKIKKYGATTIINLQK